MRDDLTLLLNEDIDSVNLCALHCEMRNTEQVLGLYAYKIGTLDCLNAMLAELGPKSMKKKFVRVKADRNKNLEVTKNDIKVASTSGRCIIVETTLPRGIGMCWGVTLTSYHNGLCQAREVLKFDRFRSSEMSISESFQSIFFKTNVLFLWRPKDIPRPQYIYYSIGGL